MRRPAARDFEVRLVVDSHRGGRVREVGDRPHDRVRFGRDLVEPLLDGGGLVANAAALFLERVALGRRRLADGAGRSRWPCDWSRPIAIAATSARFPARRSDRHRPLALRFLQLSLTSSTLSTMNLGSSMGTQGKCLVSSKTRIISAFTSGCQSRIRARENTIGGAGHKRLVTSTAPLRTNAIRNSCPASSLVPKSTSVAMQSICTRRSRPSHSITAS